MSIDAFYDLKDKNDELLLAPTNFAILAAPFGTTIPTSLVDETGSLIALPTGWFSFGEIQKAAGVSMAPELSLTGPEGYGSRGRRRDLVESENYALEFTAQEARLKMLDLAMDIDTENAVINAGQTDIRFGKRKSAKLPEYSVIAIALDGDADETGDVYPYFIYPRMVNSSRSSLSMTETNIIEWAITMNLKEDPELEPFLFGLAGPGAAAFATRAGMTLPPVGP